MNESRVFLCMHHEYSICCIFCSEGTGTEMKFARISIPVFHYFIIAL